MANTNHRRNRRKPRLAAALFAALPAIAAQSGTFTADQQFFISFAQSWCTKRRPDLERLLANIDPHSPPRDRVNGAVANLEAFALAFSCPAGSPMAPPTRCAVW